MTDEAVERLAEEIFPQALKETDIQPYSLAIFEKFNLEPQPTFIFNVPLAPSMVLGDLSQATVDYVEPDVTDDDINRELTRMRREKAIIEPSSQPAKQDDQIVIDIVGHCEDEEIIYGEDEVNFLNLDEPEPFPGFKAKLIDLAIEPDQEYKFTLTYGHSEVPLLSRTLCW